MVEEVQPSVQRVFGPEATGNMIEAFQAALGILSRSGEYRSDLSAHAVRDLLASRIIAEAQRGELHPEQLKEAALAGLST